MDKFVLVLSPSTVRDLDSLEEKVVIKILKKLSLLETDPFPRGKLIKKIKGKKSVFYRLRVDKYRVFYFINDRDVVVLKIIGKKDADKFIKSIDR